MLDPAGALHWPAQRLLAVADLHLEKGSASARKGQLLPPWDSRDTLDRLAILARHYQPRTIVALGDSFHDPEGAARLPAAELAQLTTIAHGRWLVWVRGNHDPQPPAGLPGDGVPEFSIGRLTFRHAAVQRAPAGEISGHYHPKARIPARAANISRPCFVANARRIILPAFGAYTGGLDVRDTAITALFREGGRVFLLGKERLFSFPL